ncbi:exoglucanase-type cellulase [Mycena rebaudengoi]|nr:exoglucanase-type cellulase [Mycena rebaudengoi]
MPSGHRLRPEYRDANGGKSPHPHLAEMHCEWLHQPKHGGCSGLQLALAALNKWHNELVNNFEPLSQANVNNWTTSPTDINSGTGKFGTCCNEMDIWEDKNAAAYTPHICTSNGLTQCTGTDCGDGDLRYDGICDKDGCDFNSYRMGDKTFLGPGLTVNTNQKFTIVTQFIANNNSISGMLTEIRRLYVQSGKVIQNSNSAIAGVTGSSIIDAFCNAQKTAFGDTNGFEDRGGLAAMGRALGRGMVLALSMYWLDSTYPTNGDASKPGILRGPCSTTSGDPKTVESQQGSSSVTYSNIRFGDIGYL